MDEEFKKAAHCIKHADDYQRTESVYPFDDYVQEKWKKMPKHLKYSNKNKPKGIIGEFPFYVAVIFAFR